MLWFPERSWKTIMLEMFNFVQLSNSQQWRGSSWCDLTPAPKFIPTRNPEIPRCWCCQRVYRMRLPALAIPKRVEARHRCTIRDLGPVGGAGVGIGGVPSGFPWFSCWGSVQFHTRWPKDSRWIHSTLQSGSYCYFFRFIPTEPVHHHMGHHLQRDHVVTRLFNL